MTDLPGNLSWAETLDWVTDHGLPNPPPWRDWPYPDGAPTPIRARLFSPIEFIALRARDEQTRAERAKAAAAEPDRTPDELAILTTEARAIQERKIRQMDAALERGARQRFLKTPITLPSGRATGVSGSGLIKNKDHSHAPNRSPDGHPGGRLKAPGGAKRALTGQEALTGHKAPGEP